jgi:D-alanyl-D-alanine carboxypeptidase
MNKKLLVVFTLIFSFTYILSGMSVSAQTASSQTAIPQTTAPGITAETAIVADADSGRIYYQKSMHKQMYPASITKIMTGLLAVENGNDTDVITAPDDIQKGMPGDAARIWLAGGEQVTQEEALYTMFLASANDSANVLALHTGGTIDNFVDMMNTRAKELGAQDTHFSNANGLPDVNNLTSAYDMAIITKKALESPTLMKYFGALTYTMPTTNMRKQTVAYQTLHKMMKYEKYKRLGVIAGKTGWETMSGHTLVTVAKQNGRTLICVVMKSDNNSYAAYNDTVALLDYGFALPASSEKPADFLKPAAVITQSAPPVAPDPVTSTQKTETEPAVENVNTVPFIISALAVCLFAFLATFYRTRKRTSRVLQRGTVSAGVIKQRYKA